jgi:methyltransferase of ATP-grasp peptide maturase system
MTPSRTPDASTMRQRMTDDLVATGSLENAAWRQAFMTVPRDVFLPRFFALTAQGDRYEAVADTDPPWLEKVYSNAVWPTQLDGDDEAWNRARRNGPVRGVPTCSSTMPSLMAAMLEALGVDDRERVLEIGTGTGYNAGLLAHRLGDQNVTSVDIDPSLTDLARQRLSVAGYEPAVITADGAGGFPDHAPYDRVIATCSVPEIPLAWLEQVRPRGVVLTHLYRDFGGHALLRLIVDESGAGHGWFLADYGTFMPTRLHQPTDPFLGLEAAVHTAGDTRPVGEGRSLDLSDDSRSDTLLAALLLPGVSRLEFQPRDSGPQLWLSGPDGSWACHDIDAMTVEQHGSRRLWDEVEHIHDVWVGLGRPERDRIGLTVTPDGHRLWVDDPGGGPSWSL